MDERKSVTLKIGNEQKVKMIKYQGEFQSHMGKKLSQGKIIDMALDWFLSLEHNWPKIKEQSGK
jgi:hypothetical protein